MPVQRLLMHLFPLSAASLLFHGKQYFIDKEYPQKPGKDLLLIAYQEFHSSPAWTVISFCSSYHWAQPTFPCFFQAFCWQWGWSLMNTTCKYSFPSWFLNRLDQNIYCCRKQNHQDCTSSDDSYLQSLPGCGKCSAGETHLKPVKEALKKLLTFGKYTIGIPCGPH